MVFALTRKQDYIVSPGKGFDSGEIHTGFTLKINLWNRTESKVAHCPLGALQRNARTLAIMHNFKCFKIKPNN